MNFVLEVGTWFGLVSLVHPHMSCCHPSFDETDLILYDISTIR